MLEPELQTPEPRKPVWGIWQTLGFGLAVFFAQVLAQVVIAAIYYEFEKSSHPDWDLSAFVDSLDTDGLYLSIGTIASAIIGIGLIVLFIRLRKGFNVTEYLALKSVTRKQVLAMIGIFLGLILMAGLAADIAGETGDSDFTTEIYETSRWPVLFGIAIVIFAPLSEEFFFRGFLFTGFSQAPLGAAGAVVLTSVLFTMLHVQYEAFGMGTIFVLAIVLGIVRYKTGTLWCPIIIHYLWNLVVVIGTAIESS